MQFSKNKQFIYFASIVVAFVSLVLRNYYYAKQRSTHTPRYPSKSIKL